MEKKDLYEKPEIVIIEFVIEDSIATSGINDINGAWLEELWGN